jgi:hypothetical protein
MNPYEIARAIVDKWYEDQTAGEDDLVQLIGDTIKEGVPQETEVNTVRWHLQCIPVRLDRAVRIKQAETGKRYICQQVVEDLTQIYLERMDALPD